MSDRYANMKNSQATQGLIGQRAKFTIRFDNKGTSRNLSSQFPDGPLVDPDTSYTETKDRFLKDLYENGINNGVDIHPDFENGYTGMDYTYKLGTEIHAEDLVAADQPSKMGPNLKVLAIDDTGTPIVSDDHERIVPESGGQLGNGRGFGTAFSRNRIGNYSQPAVASSYIERKEAEDQQARPRLGEYINISNYLSDPTE